MNQYKLMQALALLDRLSTEGVTQAEAVERLVQDLCVTRLQAQLVAQTWLRIETPPAPPSHQDKPSNS